MGKSNRLLNLYHYLQDPHLVARFQHFCGVRETFSGTLTSTTSTAAAGKEADRTHEHNNGACRRRVAGGDDSGYPAAIGAGEGEKAQTAAAKGVSQRVASSSVATSRGEESRNPPRNGAPVSAKTAAGEAVSAGRNGRSSCPPDLTGATESEEPGNEKAPGSSGTVKPLRKNSLTGDAGQEFLIQNRFLYYAFTLGTELGNELFYITFFPFVTWNVDAFVSRRLIMVWVWVMYLGQCTKDLLGWSRPASPPVIKVEMFYNSEYSMPSTHAMSGTAIPFSLFFMTYGRWEYPFPLGFSLALCWCLLVCVSRIYMGMHSVLRRSTRSRAAMGGLEVKLKGLSIARWCRLTSPTYLLDVALQPAGLLAVSCSDFTVRLHSRDTLDLVGEYQGHRGPLCGVVFSHASPDFLYSASADGTVRGWDVRRPGTAAAQVFKGDPAHAYSGFDLSCSDTLLCAGTEQVDREDSYLVFWDVRKPGGGLLGAYSESHSDDITQVRFHPREKDRLASGSLDGLVNVFDLSRGTEEDALLATCNSDSSAGSICWAGAAYTQLLCLSANERLHLWDLGRLDTEEPLNVFGAADGRDLPQLAGGGAVDYLVGAQWLEEAQKLLVVGGANDGDVHLMECSGGGLHLLKTLERGHASIVRCFLWDAAKEALVTGGEDALLLLWKQQEAELMAGKRQSRKSESASRFKSRAHNNYSYHRGNK